MTDAQVSQVAVETIRTNLAVDAQVSQLVVEVLRPNAAKGVSASVGTFTLTGIAAVLRIGHKLSGIAGSFTLTGVAASKSQTRRLLSGSGAFTLTGKDATFVRPGRLFADPGAFVLTGKAAQLKHFYRTTASTSAYTLTGKAATPYVTRRVSASYGTFTLTGCSVFRGIAGNPGSFTLTGQAASLKVAPSAVIQDVLYFAEETPAGWNAATTATDTFAFIDQLVISVGITFASTITITEAFVEEFYPGAVINEQFGLGDAQVPSYIFSKELIDTAAIAETLTAAIPVDLADTFTVDDVAAGVVSLLILDALTLVDMPDGDATYGVALADALYASDSLARFLDGSVSDEIAVAEALAVNPRLPQIITDLFSLSDLSEGQLLIRVTAADDVVFSDTTPAKWIFSPTIVDQLEIVVGYIAPNGDFTTWAVNTRTGAVTEYQNFEFNSFAQLGHKYLGASSSGLYELDGDTDDGTDVVAHIKSGYAQFGGSKYTSFKAAYLGMRGDGDVILKLDTGDGKTYTYQTVIQDMQSTKVRFGKGLRARYFSFELISTGPDFDLDTIEFLPLVAQRRV